MAKAKTLYTVTYPSDKTWVRRTFTEKKLRRFLKQWIPLRHVGYMLYIERHDRKVGPNRTPWLP